MRSMAVKSVIMAAMLLALPLAGKMIDNFQQDGFPVLVPAVQQLERIDETFTLTKTLTVSAPEEAKNEAKLVGRHLSKRFTGFKIKTVADGEAAKCRLIITEDDVPESPEGYTLEINRSGITVKARNTQGLYYGVQTLGNIINNTVKIHLPGCRITDWPDLKTRGLFINLRQLESKDVPKFAKVIDAMGSMKFNTLVLEFAENLPMKNNPFTARKNFITQKDLDTLLDAAKRNHIDIIPHLQVLTHDIWLSSHPDYWTKITARKNGVGPNWKWQGSNCPEQPLGRQLTEYTIRETVRLLKPKYFHLCMDEFAVCHWDSCDHCPNGHNTDQLVREVKYYFELAEELKFIPWVYHDSFRPGLPEHSDEALKVMPRSTVINMWSYLEEPSVHFFDFFKKAGYPVVGVSHCQYLINTQVLPQKAKEHDVDGVIHTYWGHLHYNFMRPIGISAHSAAGTTLSANYMWKTSDVSFMELKWDPAWELRRRIAKYNSRRPGSKMAEIPIAGTFNAKIGNDSKFPIFSAEAAKKFQDEAAANPAKFQVKLTDDGKIAATVLSGGSDDYPVSKITFPINAVAKGLSFLTTTSRPTDQTKFGLGRASRPRFMPPVAGLKVTYANGKVVKHPLNFRMDINDWNWESSGYNCRAVIRGNDANNANYTIYSIDWNNPRPKDKIKSVEFYSLKKFGIAPAIFAISAYLPEGDIPESDVDIPANLKEYHAAGKAVKATKSYAVNFNRGMGKAKFLYDNTFSTPPKAKLVKDPKTGKQVLKITIPTAKERFARVRVMVDVPFPKVRKLGSAFFGYKIDQPEKIQHSGIYISDDGYKNYHTMFAFHREFREANVWHQVYASLDVMPVAGPGGKKLAVNDAKIMRLSFWVVNHTKPVTLWIDAIGMIPESIPWTTKPFTRKVE